MSRRIRSARRRLGRQQPLPEWLRQRLSAGSGGRALARGAPPGRHGLPARQPVTGREPVTGVGAGADGGTEVGTGVGDDVVGGGVVGGTVVGGTVVGVAVGLSPHVQMGEAVCVGVVVGVAVEVADAVAVGYWWAGADVDAIAECEANSTVKLVAASVMLASPAILARFVIFNAVTRCLPGCKEIGHTWCPTLGTPGRNVIESQPWDELDRFVVIG